MSDGRAPHRGAAVRRAIELKADDCWSYAEIADIIGRETGRRPSRSTVRRWTDPEWAERDRVQGRARHERLRRKRGVRSRYGDANAVRELTDEVLLALREEDQLTYPSISRVVWRFYAVRMTEWEVRHRLYALGVKPNPNKSRATARANRARAAA